MAKVINCYSVKHLAQILILVKSFRQMEFIKYIAAEGVKEVSVLLTFLTLMYRKETSELLLIYCRY